MSLSKEREKVIREHAEYCIDCLGSHGENITVELLAEIDALRAALESIDNMSACYPFAPDPRDLCRAMGERAQEALGKQGE